MTDQGKPSVCQAASSYPPHDCYAWNHKHYHLTPHYTSSRCGVCGLIIGFRWRKWTDRLRSLFTDEPKYSRLTHD